MCRFIETIRIENGNAHNLDAHERRMNQTRKVFFQNGSDMQLSSLLTPSLYSERTRCRIEYDEEIVRIEYIPYQLRPVYNIKAIQSDTLDYRFKYADRSVLDHLFKQKGNADEIIIIQDKRLTDTTICNIALWNGQEWITPAEPLLRGTMREKLLSEQKITKGTIHIEELNKYQRIRLFNAMIDFGEVELPVSAITCL